MTRLAILLSLIFLASCVSALVRHVDNSQFKDPFPQRLSGDAPTFPPRMHPPDPVKMSVSFSILADGTTANFKLLHLPDGYPGFEEAARKAIATWRFEPPRYQGEIVQRDNVVQRFVAVTIMN